MTTERNGEYWVAELGFEEAGSLHASLEEGEEEKLAGPRVPVVVVGGAGVIGCLSWAWRREARSSGGRSQETLPERNGEYWVAELGFEEAGSLHASQEEGEEETVGGSRVAVAVSYQQIRAGQTAAGWQVSDEPRDGGADRHRVGVGGNIAEGLLVWIELLCFVS